MKGTMTIDATGLEVAEHELVAIRAAFAAIAMDPFVADRTRSNVIVCGYSIEAYDTFTPFGPRPDVSTHRHQQHPGRKSPPRDAADPQTRVAMSAPTTRSSKASATRPATTATPAVPPEEGLDFEGVNCLALLPVGAALGDYEARCRRTAAGVAALGHNAADRPICFLHRLRPSMAWPDPDDSEAVFNWARAELRTDAGQDRLEDLWMVEAGPKAKLEDLLAAVLSLRSAPKPVDLGRGL
jgi:hypothetical protein